MPKQDIKIEAGDRVEYMTVLSGLSGGSCRVIEKEVERVDEEADKVYFTDGTTYNHTENPGMTLRVIGHRPQFVIM